jgi:hypothetical protein
MDDAFRPQLNAANGVGGILKCDVPAAARVAAAIAQSAHHMIVDMSAAECFDLGECSFCNFVLSQSLFCTCLLLFFYFETQFVIILL